MPLAKDPKATEGLESRLRASRKDDSVERATTAVIEGHLLASHLDGTRVQHTDASGGHLDEGVNEARHTGTPGAFSQQCKKLSKACEGAGSFVLCATAAVKPSEITR